MPEKRERLADLARWALAMAAMRRSIVMYGELGHGSSPGYQTWHAEAQDCFRRRGTTG